MRGINEQLLKTSGEMFYRLGKKKTQKNFRGVAPTSPLYIWRFRRTTFKLGKLPEFLLLFPVTVCDLWKFMEGNKTYECATKMLGFR